MGINIKKFIERDYIRKLSYSIISIGNMIWLKS